MTPLQRYYLSCYLETGVLSTMRQTSDYQLVTVADRQHHTRPVTEADVQPGSTAQPIGKPIPLALSEAAHASGVVLLYRGAKVSYQNRPLHEYLRRFVYDGNGFLAIFRVPLWSGLAAFLFQLPFAVRKDVQRLKEMKYGRLLKGPVLVSPKGFNRAIKGDGVGFRTTESKDLMRIPQRAEGQHIELMGDTGTGKTRLIMQLLVQIRERGHSAIVYDPACEFVQRFYDPKTDIILNPLDAPSLPLLGALRGTAPPCRGQGHCCLALSTDDGQERRVFHRDTTEDFCPSADLRPKPAGVGGVDGKPR